MSTTDTATRPGPEIIDITDLRNPILNDIQKGALAQADANPVTFVMEEILAEAREQTGLSDFGALDFKERLQLWCESVDGDPNVSGSGGSRSAGLFLRYAAQRLRVEDYVKRHPEVLDIVIDRPIVVGGLPRSGTTHLVNLLGADPRLRNLPWWEAVAPVPAPGDEPTAEDPNPRPYARGKELGHHRHARALSKDHARVYRRPYQRGHRVTGARFSTYLMEWLVTTPRWRDYYLGHDQTGPYAYLKKVLQVLTHLKGPNRWAIKCPQHMEHLAVLYKPSPMRLSSWPIAIRSPRSSRRSPSCATTAASSGSGSMADERAEYWIDRYKRLLHRFFVEAASLLPDAPDHRRLFHEWTQGSGHRS